MIITYERQKKQIVKIARDKYFRGGEAQEGLENVTMKNRYSG